MEAAAAAALGIALSPLPLLAVAALLGSPGTTRTATAFVAGETVTIAAIAATVVAVTTRQLDAGTLDPTFAVLQLAVAAVLAALLVVHALRRESPARAARLLDALDGVRPAVAFGAGVLLVALNPKNLALTLAGAAAIVDLDRSAGLELAAVAAFTGLAVSVLAVAVACYAVAPARAGKLLARGRGLLLRRERVVVAVVLGALAALFLVRGLVDLAG